MLYFTGMPTSNVISYCCQTMTNSSKKKKKNTASLHIGDSWTYAAQLQKFGQLWPRVPQENGVQLVCNWPEVFSWGSCQSRSRVKVGLRDELEGGPPH